MKNKKRVFKKTSCNAVYVRPSITKAHMNVNLYKKPIQTELEKKFTFESKQPGPCIDVTHLYK